jgi:hypothetical protein
MHTTCHKLCAREKDKRTDNPRKSALFVTRLKYFCSVFRAAQIFERVSLNVEALGLTLRSDRPGQFSAQKRSTHNLLGKIKAKLWKTLASKIQVEHEGQQKQKP